MLLGTTACGEKPVPEETLAATDHDQTAPPSDNAVTEKISRLMEFYEETGQFGGAILVAQDGNIIYEDAFGWANLEWRIPNAMHTKFRTGSFTVARQIAAIINDLEYDPPTISAASAVGQAVLESGGDVASTTMTELHEHGHGSYRFQVEEFLLVADRLAEHEKHDEACQVLNSYVRYSPAISEIRQKLAEYCE
jgi:hypothetical protein